MRDPLLSSDPQLRRLIIGRLIARAPRDLRDLIRDHLDHGPSVGAAIRYLHMMPRMERGDWRRRVLGSLVDRMAARPQNDRFWAWTIRVEGDTPYLTRALFPRLAGARPMLHHIHRADGDPELHNHPWAYGVSLILAGGYLEVRRRPDASHELRSYGPGDVNAIEPSDFHRIGHVMPGTWTLFVAGDRVQDWGFLRRMDEPVAAESYVPHSAWLAQRGLKVGGVRS